MAGADPAGRHSLNAVDAQDRAMPGGDDPLTGARPVTDAELVLISARANFFFALADYRAALALDPLATNR